MMMMIMKNQPKISIIILNWNSWEDTNECLESLYQIDYLNYEVVVIDNGSKDDSIKKIKQYANKAIIPESNFYEHIPNKNPIKIFEYNRENEDFELDSIVESEIEEYASNEKLILIKNQRNDGFPEGCNIGMRYALKKGINYFLLLNNDTVVDKQFLNELIEVAESDSSIGIVGSKILYYYTPDTIQAAGGKIRWLLGDIITYGNEKDKGQYDKLTERDYLYGTSLLLKKEVIDKISFMDTSFFFGVEEYDYCTKAKRAGLKIVYVPSSKVWHKVGASRAKISEDPETANLVQKTGGSKHSKYYYNLFKRFGVPYIFIFSYAMFMILRITGIRDFMNYASKGDWKTIRNGIYKRINF